MQRSRQGEPVEGGPRRGGAGGMNMMCAHVECSRFPSRTESAPSHDGKVKANSAAHHETGPLFRRRPRGARQRAKATGKGARVFAAFDYTSFFSVWYWVLTIGVWAQVCHRTLGVPYDMILRAERLPGVAAEVDQLAGIAARRVAAIHRAVGSWAAGLLGFLLAALAVLGFVNWIEPAQAAFLLLLPLSVVQLQSVRLALQIDRTGMRGDDLRRRLGRRRAWNQTIAIAATFFAALVAMLHHPATLLMLQ